MIYNRVYKLALSLITLGIVAACTGCSGNGVGNTVPSPPRSLVQQSFKQHGAPMAQGSTSATNAAAGKR